MLGSWYIFAILDSESNLWKCELCTKCAQFIITAAILRGTPRWHWSINVRAHQSPGSRDNRFVRAFVFHSSNTWKQKSESFLQLPISIGPYQHSAPASNENSITIFSNHFAASANISLFFSSSSMGHIHCTSEHTCTTGDTECLLVFAKCECRHM